MMRFGHSHAVAFTFALACACACACARNAPAPEASASAPAASAAPATTINAPPGESAAVVPIAPMDAAAPFLSKCDGVALEIALRQPSQGLEIDAKLRNQSKAKVPLMLTGDGSSFGKRYPRMSFALVPDDIGNPGTCGFINAMEDTDFITLDAGQSKKLEWVHAPTPGKPGHYTVKATYRNDPSAEPLGSGAPHPPTPAQRARVAATIPCEITSNALAIDWDGKNARLAR